MKNKKINYSISDNANKGSLGDKTKKERNTNNNNPSYLPKGEESNIPKKFLPSTEKDK